MAILLFKDKSCWINYFIQSPYYFYTLLNFLQFTKKFQNYQRKTGSGLMSLTIDNINEFHRTDKKLGT